MPNAIFFFYARPHNPRNLFLIGMQAIEEAIKQGIIDPQHWDIHLVGKDLPKVLLADTVAPHLSQNLAWDEYAALIRTMDVGLSLMHTPHPSYPPLDLAASGAVVVSSRYGSKQSLSSYSDNIFCAEPDPLALANAIRQAVALSEDSTQRRLNYESGSIQRDWRAALKPAIEHVLNRRDVHG